MLATLNKALSTVFVLGIIVSFSSLLFLLFFYNFLIANAFFLVVSVLLCAGFQIAAFLGGNVFEKRLWPAILCLLPCSLGTVWAGVMGPAALFGMPSTVFADVGKGFSAPLYYATLPLTVAGTCTGLAYFALGLVCIIHDGKAIKTKRKLKQHRPQQKDEIYEQVFEKLNIPPNEKTPEKQEINSQINAETSFINAEIETLIENWEAQPVQLVLPQNITVVLETESLRIVRLNEKTFSALLLGVKEMEETAGFAKSGEILDANTQAAFASLYSKAMQDVANYKWFAVWVLLNKKQNKLVGSAGFNGPPSVNGEVKMAYSINKAQKETAFAQEAKMALRQWALLQKNVKHVILP